ncbi:MAG TPA: DUF1045 domain-containing protein [Devosia sp.]|nr:DUF1045 domain-containing protein [Devosia sp.]
MAERYGIYYAPAPSSELWRLAAIWLGRDALTGAALEADVGGIDPEHRHARTKSARRYGFHATLKAPMPLGHHLEGKDLDRALKAWTAVHGPVDIGPLVLKPVEGFLALVPAEQSAALTAFAGKVVEDFEGFRAPLSGAERARRLAGGHLTPRQVAYVERYGYPYVFEEFRFHMTLTDRLPAEEQADFRAAIEGVFAPVLGGPVLLDRLALYREAEPGAPFERLRDYPLIGEL